MKTYTVTAIRTTLYSIIQNIFTPVFIHQYESNVAEYESRATIVMNNEAEHADFAILQMAVCLDSPADLDRIITNLKPETIFTLYLRYYMLSRYLEMQKQSDTFKLPAEKEEFFKHLLIDYWKKALA